jgi:hypothetical protein
MAARAGQEGLVAVAAAAAVVVVVVVVVVAVAAAAAVAAVDQEEVAAEAVIDNYVVVMVQTVILSKKAPNGRTQTTPSHLLAAHSPCFGSADPAFSPFFQYRLAAAHPPLKNFSDFL